LFAEVFKVTSGMYFVMVQDSQIKQYSHQCYKLSEATEPT